MTLKHAQFSRGLARATSVAAVVGLCAVAPLTIASSALGLASAAEAATTHFGPITAPVAVGEKPVAVAYDTNVNPTTGHEQVYVANATSNSVSVIDAVTHQVTATISLGNRASTQPAAIAINQAEDLVFVVEYADDAVAIIDGKTNEIVRTVSSNGSAPDAIAWDSQAHRMYVASYIDGNVSALDDRTGVVIAPGGTFTVGSGGATSKPEGIAVDPVSRMIVVAAQGDNAVYVYDADRPTVYVGLVGTFASPNAVAIDTSLHRAYIANYDNQTVSAFDLSTNHEVSGSPIAVGANPNALAVDPVSGTVYVANFNDTALSVIDPSGFSVTDAGPVGAKPSSVAVGNGEVYVTNQADNTVSILGTTVSPTITSGGPADGTVGSAYSFPVTATGTPASITFSVTGQLPPGIALVPNGDGSTASLAGTPTQSGDFTFTLHASNGVDPEATATYTLHVAAAVVTPGTQTPNPDPHLPQVAG